MDRPDTALELPQDLFRQAVEASADGVVVTDATRPDRPIVYVNPAFERLTGYRAAEVLGKNCRFLQGNDRDQPERARLRRAIDDELPCSVLLRNYRKDGSLFWNELSVTPCRDSGGRTTHFLAIQKDVTARVRLEKTVQEHEKNLERATEAAQRLASRDPLTNVTNRGTFLEHLGREWKRAARDGGPVALLLVNLDGFRGFNARYGHEAGDEALVRVAATLEGVLKRPADLLARLGDDEFAALLPATDAAGAARVARAMQDAVRALRIGNEPAGPGAVLTASVGAGARVPGNGRPCGELIDAAEAALAEARSAAAAGT